MSPARNYHGSQTSLVEDNDGDEAMRSASGQDFDDDSISDCPDDASCNTEDMPSRRGDTLQKLDTFKGAEKKVGILKKMTTLTRKQSTQSTRSTYSVSVDNLSDRDLEWLQGDHFLERLEHEEDLDPDVLQREVDTLPKKKTKTCRHRMERFLTSTPCQIIVLVIAFLDAVAVITSVILDMESHRVETDYLKCQRHHLVRLVLNLTIPQNKSNDNYFVIPGKISGIDGDLTSANVYDLIEILEAKVDEDQKYETVKPKPKMYNTTWLDIVGNETVHQRRPRARAHKAPDKTPWRPPFPPDDRGTTASPDSKDSNATCRQLRDLLTSQNNPRKPIRPRSAYATVKDVELTPYLSPPPLSLKECREITGRAKELKHISHLLHYTSIALLSVLLLEVILKVIAMGLDFFHHKLEIMDSIVILVSFILDLVFIHDHDKNLAVAIFLFIWQMLRVLSALINHDKKRIEFLMQVMKESNVKMHQQNQLLRRKVKQKKKQLGNLRLFCEELGATDDQIQDCLSGVPTHVRRKTRAASKAKNVLSASWEALSTFKKRTSLSLSTGLPPLSIAFARSPLERRRRNSSGSEPAPEKSPVQLKSLQYTSSFLDIDLRQRGKRHFSAGDLCSSSEEGSVYELGPRGRGSGRESSVGSSGSLCEPDSTPEASLPSKQTDGDFVLQMDGIENRGYLEFNKEKEKGYCTDTDPPSYDVAVLASQGHDEAYQASISARRLTMPSIVIEDCDRKTKL